MISISLVSFSYAKLDKKISIFNSTAISSSYNTSTPTNEIMPKNQILAASEYDHYSNQFVLGILMSIISLVGYISTGGKTNSKDSALAYNNNNNKSKEIVNLQENYDITFEDVGGLEEVKEDLKEVIDFIKNNEKYEKMGAKIPKGVILYGPPGTGKTLIAKVMASESECNFFSTSASEFIEKYVGVGAQRVRELFKKAREKTPSIIFIDEIDAVAGERGEANNGEKDQTLNQLLVEMDGMGTRNNIIVIAATNRLDILDQAILRPGRFDRHIYIGLPNLMEREHILKIHTKDKRLSNSVNLNQLARRTSGLSGASLANIVNEAAIHAVKMKKCFIETDDLNYAFEKVVAGLRRKNSMVSLKEKKTIAFHEAGHALVAKLLSIDNVEKISIIPSGQALGYVIQTPSEDKALLTKSELISKIEVILGGRACEELVFGEVTTGAANDLQKATEIVIKMVCEYGMGKHIPYKLSPNYGNLDIKTLNEETLEIINESYEKVKSIIESNIDKIERIASVLLENEEIEADEIENLIS